MPTHPVNDELLARLNRFNLKARQIVEGFMIGLHRSPYHGFSVEFSDHRQYNPGDSLRNLDWKVFGKTGRYYVKRYEEETNLRAYLLVDHSRSMGYMSGDLSKLDFARTLAASLAYLLIRQQDAVGLLTFSDTVTAQLPPRSMRSYLSMIFRELVGMQPGSGTQTAQALHHLAERLKKRGLVILITDLLDDPDAVFSGLRHFLHQKHEVIVFHIQDRMEIDFDFRSEVQFIDSESGEKLTVQPWQIRKDYIDAYSSAVRDLKQRCYEAGIDYHPITTDTPFDQALMLFLTRRERMV